MQSQLGIESWTMAVPEAEPYVDQSRETIHPSLFLLRDKKGL